MLQFAGFVGEVFQLVQSWSDMRLTDERARRKKKKERDTQKLEQDEQRQKTLNKVKIILVLVVIASIFIGGFLLVYTKQQKKQELEIMDLLMVEFTDLNGLVEVTPRETGKPAKFTSTTQKLSGAGRVETGQDGRVVFQFSDGLEITLFPNSVFEIKSLNIGPSNTLFNESVLEKGTCVVRGKPIPEALTLHTQFTTITSQGRDFSRFKVESIKSSERVASDKALLQIKYKASSGGQPSVKMLKPLRQLKISRKGFSEPAHFNPLSESWR